MVNEFQTVYDLYTCIKAISQVLNLYDMRDAFQIIPENTVEHMGVELANLFTRQDKLDQATDNLQMEPSNDNFLVAHTGAKSSAAKVVTVLEGGDIVQ